MRAVRGAVLLLMISVVTLWGSEKIRVVLLHSYHHGYQWADNLTQGFTQELTSAQLPVDIVHEYLHAKRYEDESDGLLAALLKQRYQNLPVDAVVAFDDTALDFLLSYGREIFAHQPFFFAGANDFDPSRLGGLSDITGISEIADIKANIDLILSHHPQTEEILLILDQTDTAKRILAALEPKIKPLEARVKIRLLEPLNAEGLTNHLKELRPESVVLYGFFSRDSEETFFEYDEAARMVAQASAVPVYVLWDFALGSGAVGGWVLSGHTHGKTSAQQVLRFLQGTPIEQIPLHLESITTPIFDAQVLSRHGINPSMLPKNAQLINQPKYFYEEYQKVTVGFLTILTLLLVALATLLYQWLRASAKTKDQARLLNQIAQNTDTVFWVRNAKQILYVSPAYEKLWGRSCQSLYDDPKSLLGAIHPQDQPTLPRALCHAQQPPKNHRGSYRILRPDGTFCWVQIHITAVKNSKKFAWVGVAEDITSQKKNEAILGKFNHALSERVERETARFQKLQQEKDRQQLLFAQQSKNAALGEVIANIAHQWRQPINILAAQLYNIRRSHNQGRLDAPLMGSYYNEARAIIDQMSRMIDDFRDLFRTDSDRAELFCLDDEIAKVVRIHGPILERYQIDILPPATSSEFQVFGYRNDFIQILMELITYIKRAIIEESHPQRQIKIELKTSENGPLVSLLCDSQNINTDLDKPDTKLYIVRTLLEKIKGHLQISKSHEGVQFCLTIPSIPDETQPKGVI